ncbi:MAG: SDR family NAD(P)-dependent oxidoreductase, partial [Desulfobacteraceae bacterium]
MLEIKDSVAVITGGGGGIGLEVAKYWMRNGGKVVIADISENLLGQAEAELKTLGDDVLPVVTNVTSEEDNGRLAAAAIEKYGQINLVAPFAGIIRDAMMVSPDRETGKVTRKMTLSDFKIVVEINLTGVFLTVRECAERMINHNCRGLICLVSSTGSMGTAGQLNYSSTKAAMSVMPKVITAEFFRRGLADRIRCVAVAPGYVGTAMVKGMNQKALDNILSQVPIGRLIEPEEVAQLVGDIYRNEALAGEVFFIHGG